MIGIRFFTWNYYALFGTIAAQDARRRQADGGDWMRAARLKMMKYAEGVIWPPFER
ncbi:MAG: hypothetical protein ABR956_14390 [Terracidiphilus sp.]